MKINKKFNKDKLWFTSDTHFFHSNIIKFANRPFDNMEEMNEALIKNWNELVQEDDDVFITGDFALTGNIDKITWIAHRLNGNIYLVLGNHDYQNRIERPILKENLAFVEVSDVMTIEVEDEELEDKKMKIFMSHYPHLYWMRGFVHLCGHIHSGPNSKASEVPIFNPMMYDVGCDNNLYKPVSYEEMKIIITKQMMQNKFIK